MTGLPPGLEAWRDRLAGLAPEVAASLAPWLPRLAGLLGPLHPRDRTPGGEPDGYRGLDRKVAWHRLPPSAWVLAQAAPDEFLRRAAMAEHLFFDLERREPAGQRQALVLFDAGPDSLGAPRLAHLALLAVLAGRAEAAGGRLVWGVLQDPEVRGEGWSPQAARRLLGARTGLAGRLDDLDLWLDLGTPAEDWDEVWLVGAAGLGSGLPAGVGLLAVAEPPRLADPVVEITCRPPGGAPRRVCLPLPSPARRAHILTDPFPAPPTPPAPASEPRPPGPTRRLDLALRPGFFFCESSLRLLGVDADGDAVAVRVPVKQRRLRWIHRLPLAAGWTAVGMAWTRRGLVVLSTHGDRWRVQDQGGRRVVQGRLGEGLVAPDLEAGQALSVVVPLWGPDPERFVVRDAAGTLLCLDRQDRAPPVVLARRSLVLGRPSGRIAAVTPDPEAEGRTALRTTTGTFGEGNDTRNPTPPGTTAAWIGFGGGALPDRSVALQAEDGAVFAWCLRRDPLRSQWWPVPVTPQTRVCGATADPRDPARIGVLTLTHDRRLLLVEGVDGLRLTVPGVEGRVRHACTAPSLPLVAWQEESGVVKVFDLRSRRLLLRAAPPAAP